MNLRAREEIRWARRLCMCEDHEPTASQHNGGENGREIQRTCLMGHHDFPVYFLKSGLHSKKEKWRAEASTCVPHDQSGLPSTIVRKSSQLWLSAVLWIYKRKKDLQLISQLCLIFSDFIMQAQFRPINDFLGMVASKPGHVLNGPSQLGTSFPTCFPTNQLFASRPANHGAT